MQDAAFTITSSYVSMSLLLCGFYIRVKDMPLSFIKGLTWATFSKYTLQGLAHNEFQDRDWSDTTSTCSTQTPRRAPSGVFCFPGGYEAFKQAFQDFHAMLLVFV